MTAHELLAKLSIAEAHIREADESGVALLFELQRDSLKHIRRSLERLTEDLARERDRWATKE